MSILNTIKLIHIHLKNKNTEYLKRRKKIVALATFQMRKVMEKPFNIFKNWCTYSKEFSQPKVTTMSWIQSIFNSLIHLLIRYNSSSDIRKVKTIQM